MPYTVTELIIQTRFGYGFSNGQSRGVKAIYRACAAKLFASKSGLCTFGKCVTYWILFVADLKCHASYIAGNKGKCRPCAFSDHHGMKAYWGAEV
jgi:hypothetical protein